MGDVTHDFALRVKAQGGFVGRVGGLDGMPRLHSECGFNRPTAQFLWSFVSEPVRWMTERLLPAIHMHGGR